MTDPNPPMPDLSARPGPGRIRHPAPAGSEITSARITNERTTRAEVSAMGSTAAQLWRDMSGGSREALVSLITEALTHMVDTVDEWLEDSLVAESDEKIGIFVMFKLGHLDQRLLELRAEHATRRLQQIAHLAELADGSRTATG